MSFSSRISFRVWLIAPLCAILFTIWAGYERAQRVKYVSGIAAEDAVLDSASPTGYSEGKRWLIVPEHNNRSYQWITETEQMLTRHEWRVRRVDHENAPFGREVHSASLYRWWLGLLALGDHTISGRSLGLSLERTALFAEPLLQVLLLAIASVFVARRFGPVPGTLVCLGLTLLFPLAGAFLPGVPDDFGLMQGFALWSVLPLLAGVFGRNAPAVPRTPSAERWFFFAGITGGIGLWINATDQTAIIGGIALGGVLAAWIFRGSAKSFPGSAPIAEPLLWRLWALGGAATCLAAYLIEYFPAHMDLHLRVNHPLYGLAWIGAGELLVWFTSWMQLGKTFRSYNDAVRCILGLAAVMALPVAMIREDSQMFSAWDLLSAKLTNLSAGAMAFSFPAWVSREGLTSMTVAVGLPALLVIPAAWLLFRRATENKQRVALAIVIGPIVVTIALACLRLRWWNTFDAMLLALLVAATTGPSGRSHLVWFGIAGAILALGSIPLWPAGKGGSDDFKFTQAEVEGLYERALAHWIRDHSNPGETGVLVPPYRTSSFCFYGGLNGLGTQNWENRDGLHATFRVVNSTRPDETQGLLNERAIKYIVLPSWDTDLQDFARAGLKQPEESFIYALDHWQLFKWIRPLPYKLPVVSGFEGQSVKIFEVTEDADPATHRSRLVEYFIEMQRVDAAVQLGESLRQYPANVGALVTLALAQKAQGDMDAFAKTFSALLSNLSTGSDRNLPWDRRVSLAVVLALGGRADLARAQVQRCLKEITASRIRSLTVGSLYRLQVLDKAYNLQISDPQFRDLALKLLPVELRERLQ